MIEIEKLLKDYRRKSSSLEVLRIERERIIKKLNRIPDEVKYCDTTSVFKFEPPTFKIQRTVEDAGIKSAEIHKDLQASLNIFEQKIEELEPEVKTIEALVKSLDDTEKTIIEKFYFHNWQWYALSAELHMSIKALKARRIKAFMKMKEVLKVKGS